MSSMKRPQKIQHRNKNPQAPKTARKQSPSSKTQPHPQNLAKRMQPTPRLLTAAGVSQLQRAVGNRAVAQYLQAPPHIQRDENIDIEAQAATMKWDEDITGMASKLVQVNMAKALQEEFKVKERWEIIKEPRFIDFRSELKGDKVEERIRMLLEIVQRYMLAADIPPIKALNPQSGTGGGAFSPSTWSIKLNYSALTKKEWTWEELAELANTLNHESRHAEQAVRSSLFMIQKVQHSRPDINKYGAKFFLEKLNLPTEIVDLILEKIQFQEPTTSVEEKPDKSSKSRKSAILGFIGSKISKEKKEAPSPRSSAASSLAKRKWKPVMVDSNKKEPVNIWYEEFSSPRYKETMSKVNSAKDQYNEAIEKFNKLKSGAIKSLTTVGEGTDFHPMLEKINLSFEEITLKEQQYTEAHQEYKQYRIELDAWQVGGQMQELLGEKPDTVESAAAKESSLIAKASQFTKELSSFDRLLEFQAAYLPELHKYKMLYSKHKELFNTEFMLAASEMSGEVTKVESTESTYSKSKGNLKMTLMTLNEAINEYKIKLYSLEGVDSIIPLLFNDWERLLENIPHDLEMLERSDPRQRAAQLHQQFGNMAAGRRRGRHYNGKEGK